MTTSELSKFLKSLGAYLSGDRSRKTIFALLKKGSTVDKDGFDLNLKTLAVSADVPEKILVTRALPSLSVYSGSSVANESSISSPRTAIRATRGLVLRGKSAGPRQSR